MLVAASLLLLAAAPGDDDRYDRRDRRDDRGEINLICDGEGRAPEAKTRYGTRYNSETRKYESTRSTEVERERFDATVRVRIDPDGERGEIRLEGRLIPKVNSGGEDGWWRLSDVRVSRNTITGTYRLNPLNKPRVTLDRVAGRIRIEGMETFSGRCELDDRGGRRRF